MCMPGSQIGSKFAIIIQGIRVEYASVEFYFYLNFAQ